jgi:hypothetical protein
MDKHDDELDRQRLVDQALHEAFSELARPSLSLSFDKEMRARLAVERKRQLAARLQTRLLRIYWLVAGLSSAVILAHLQWSDQALSGPWLPVLALIITAVLPVSIALVACRIDPIDLILSTFDPPIDDPECHKIG